MHVFQLYIVLCLKPKDPWVSEATTPWLLWTRRKDSWSAELINVRWYQIPGVSFPEGIYSFLRSQLSHIKVSVSVRKHATLSSNEKRYIIWGASPPGADFV